MIGKKPKPNPSDYKTEMLITDTTKDCLAEDNRIERSAFTPAQFSRQFRPQGAIFRIWQRVRESNSSWGVWSALVPTNNKLCLITY